MGSNNNNNINNSHERKGPISIFRPTGVWLVSTHTGEFDAVRRYRVAVAVKLTPHDPLWVRSAELSVEETDRDPL